MAISIAGNGIVVVNSLDKSLVEDAGVGTTRMPLPPPFPVETRGFCLATRSTVLPGYHRINSFWVYRVGEASLRHRASRIGAWASGLGEMTFIQNLPSHDLSPAAVAEIFAIF